MKKSKEFNHLTDGALIDKGTKKHSHLLSDTESQA
jgi:hypothetical protein